jgi:hypothetical protein
VIVSHSLGAVVVRRAVLDGIKDEERWTDLVRLVMFAPAHLGANVKVLLTLTIGKILAALEAYFRTKYPVLNQLEPDSKTLELLWNESQEAARLYPNAVRAVGVAIPEIDQVADSNSFCCDPPGRRIDGTNHVSVIKPRTRAAKQFTHLIRWIGR